MPLRPCKTPDQLHAWVRLYLGIDVPRAARVPGHTAPFDYLVHAYFEPAGDVVVWAGRGGGKTRLAAAATVLDLLHKPGTSVRVLGGSLDQSLKCWEYLLPDLLRLAPSLFEGRIPTPASRRVRLTNGSDAAALPQSQTAVRGTRVQKLRCDEVELFDPDVWEAAQLVTRGRPPVAATVEALSTHHIAGGLMGRLVADTPRLLKWSVLDVLGTCEPERECGSCPLWAECRGSAKGHAGGFVSVEDAVRMKRRVSAETWRSEMLCETPRFRAAGQRVFPAFDPETHVRPFDARACDGGEAWAVGVDFGFAAPFVALWACERTGVLHVVDEYVAAGLTLPEHARAMCRRPWPAQRVHCDPAGAAVAGQTGESDAAVLRRHGFVVRYRGARIAEGLELVRRRLAPADGSAVRLVIDPQCVHLVRALASYAYAGDGGETPHKDGVHDHPVDALRYLLAGLSRPWSLRDACAY